MSANRVLVAKGWYWVSTDVNNREGVVRLQRAVQLLREVLHEARKVYEFEVRGLRVDDDRVLFYVNDVDGFAAILLNRGQPPQKKRSNLKKSNFSAVFSRLIKAKRIPNRIKYCVENYFPQNMVRRFAYECESGVSSERLVLGFHGCQ
jgi:hypothetical protein